MKTRLGASCVLALLSVAAHGQTLTMELCDSLATQIDGAASDVSFGTDYVAFARRDSSSPAALPRRSSKNYVFLAGLLRLYGECSRKGLVPDAGPNTTRRYLNASALLGDASANHELASVLVFEPLRPDEPADGVRMLQKEYDEGSAFAAGKLGWAYHMGYGVTRDDAKAFKLYEYAAEHGMTLWQVLLAHAYEQGYYGLAADADRAKYWKDFPTKVQMYTYDCAVLSLYQGGVSFPRRPEIESRYAAQCAK